MTRTSDRRHHSRQSSRATLGRCHAWLPCAALALATATATAQIDARIAPRQPAPGPVPTLHTETAAADSSDLAPLIPNLKGILFLQNAEAVAPAGAQARGIAAPGLPILETESFRRRLAPLLGKPMPAAILTQITNAVVLAYSAAGMPVVDAVIPEQDITGGTVQVVVLEGRTGDIRTEGNRHFRAGRLLRMVRLKGGETIRREALLADLDFINRNPFRVADVIFERGHEAGATDIVLRVQDRIPFRLYGGYENTGTGSTSEHRLYTGVNWGNAFGIDHRLGYQFTSAPDATQFSAHSASYTIPTPWHHELRLYGSYSESLPTMTPATGSGIQPRLRGHSAQASLRYEMPLTRFGWEVSGRQHVSLAHSIVLGADYKQLNNNLEFGGTEVFNRSLDIVEFSAGYSAQETDAVGGTSLDATLYVSPGHLTGADSGAEYESARAGANPSFTSLHLEVERHTRLPAGFVWNARAQVQFASGELVSTEQLGFGGRGRVRGYDEYSGVGDSGFIVENEVVSPAWSPLFTAGAIRERDALRAVAFWDYGQARLEGEPPPDQRKISTFSAVGAGLRYSIASLLEIQYDYAVPLTRGRGRAGRDRHHLSVQVSVPF